MRSFINKYGTPIVIVTLVVALLAYWFLGRGTKSSTGSTSQAFFIDEETGDESVHSVTELPPLAGKSGKPTVVRAVKFSCDDGKTVKTAYLTKYSAEAQSQLRSLPEDDSRRAMIGTRGEWVRSPDAGSPWVLAQSVDGAKIQVLPTCRDGHPAVTVWPRK